MMEETISKTALARKLLLDFWSDLSQHSIAEFTNYLQENDLAEIKQTHINSATQLRWKVCRSRFLPGRAQS